MSPNTKQSLLREVEKMLMTNSNRMLSREEILNSLAHLDKDNELEQILAELEVGSSEIGASPPITAKCRGGTVYYRWEKKV